MIFVVSDVGVIASNSRENGMTVKKELHVQLASGHQVTHEAATNFVVFGAREPSSTCNFLKLFACMVKDDESDKP